MNLKPVYVLVGSDAASIHVRLEALKGAFTAIHGDLTIESYDANSTSPDEILMTLMSTSLLAGNRIVLVRSFDKWSSSTKKGADEAVGAIANQYLTDPDEGTVLILIGEKMPKKTRAWKELAAAVRAHAGTKPNILEYDLPREWDMHQWVSDLARMPELGLDLDKPTAEYLLSVAGSDSMTIYNELFKIAAYLRDSGRNRVSRGDVDMLVIPRNHMSEFKFIEALSRGNMAEAEQVLAQLGGKTAASQLAFVVARELRLMAALRSLMDAKAGDAKLKAALKSRGFFRVEPTDWVLKQLKQRAAGWTDERLVRCLRTLADLDFSLKGGTADPKAGTGSKFEERYQLERFMYGMTLPGRG